MVCALDSPDFTEPSQPRFPLLGRDSVRRSVAEDKTGAAWLISSTSFLRTAPSTNGNIVILAETLLLNSYAAGCLLPSAACAPSSYSMTGLLTFSQFHHPGPTAKVFHPKPQKPGLTKHCLRGPGLMDHQVQSSLPATARDPQHILCGFILQHF
jgi:hypothetical protein